MHRGLFQKIIQKRDPKAIGGQKDVCWPSPLPCSSATLKVGMRVFGRLPRIGAPFCKAPGEHAEPGTPGRLSGLVLLLSSETTRSRLPLPGHLLEASGDQVQAPHRSAEAEMCSHLATHTGFCYCAKLPLSVSGRIVWGWKSIH